MPGLWQGGTHDTDTIYDTGNSVYQPTKDDFDTVITLYGNANGAGWGVKELRFPIYDADMTDFKVEDLLDLVNTAHRDWHGGKRVLIRCQAGWNRSGLVTALTLIKDGFAPVDAITLIREKRCPEALSNRIFANWLATKADMKFWRDENAA